MSQPPTIPSICLRTAVLLSLLSVVPASELVLREVRLGVISWPASFDWTIDSEVIDASGSDAFDAAGGIDLGTCWSFAPAGSSLGAIVSGDLLMLGMPYGSGDGMLTLAGRVGGGGAWSISDRWTLALEAGIGYGLSTLDFPATDRSEASSVDGTTMFYDGRMRVIWNAGRTWSLGAHVGYVMATHELSGSGTDHELEQQGLQVGLSISWRISDVPAGLE